MQRTRSRLIAVTAALLLAVGGLAACGSDESTAAPKVPAHNAADIDFIVAMGHHHSRAIAVGQLAADKGADPRVRDFGRLIVSQQTPELNRLRSWSKIFPTSNVDQGPPEGYIGDVEFWRLKFESGTAFDRDFLLLSATSETGAAAMSQRELASGIYAPARTLATSIATAPTTQIPKLRELAAALGG